MYTITSKQQEGSTYNDSYPKCFTTTNFDKFHGDGAILNRDEILGYIVMLRARMFRSLIPVLMIKEGNICARNITI